jgi:hypothetical protein
MKFTRIFSIIFLALLSIQFNLNSCSDENGDSLTAPENKPTNDYEVVVEVVSFGGLAGCTTGSIALLNEPVSDAEFLLNGVQLSNDPSSIFSNLYTDTLGVINYQPGTSYKLEVSHNGNVIASGDAKMPSVPEVTNLEDMDTHNLNKSLEVKWKKVNNATSLEVYIDGYVYDSAVGDSVHREYSTELLSPDKVSCVIPDTLFNTPGIYVMGVTAYYGVNPGNFTVDINDTEGYTKGYNIKGAAGVFLAANVYPPTEEGIRIVVGQVNNLQKSMNRSKSFRQMMIEKNLKCFRNSHLLKK